MSSLLFKQKYILWFNVIASNAFNISTKAKIKQKYIQNKIFSVSSPWNTSIISMIYLFSNKVRVFQIVFENTLLEFLTYSHDKASITLTVPSVWLLSVFAAFDLCHFFHCYKNKIDISYKYCDTLQFYCLNKLVKGIHVSFLISFHSNIKVKKNF